MFIWDKSRRVLIKLLFLLFSFCSRAFSYEQIGISMLYSPFFHIEPDFHIELENKLIAEITNVSGKDFSASNIKEKNKIIKKLISGWKKDNVFDPEYSQVFSEFNERDYFIFFEITQFQILQEEDFYKTDKYYYVFRMKLEILVIDCKNKNIVNENTVFIDLKTDKDKNELIQASLFQTVKKVKSFIEYLAVFREKFFVEKPGVFFIKLAGGKNLKLKVNDILISYKGNNPLDAEISAVKITAVEDDSATALVQYTKKKVGIDEVFYKKQKSSFEIQAGGGFYIADSENDVSSKNESVSFLTSAFIRGLIPVGIPFFKPVFQVEFNFFLLDNKFLLPFSFETGGFAEFNIHRFGFGGGLLLGALFSPDSKRNYKLDSVVVRPFVQLYCIALVHMKIFLEIGYRFINDNIFYKEWKVDMKGAYFIFGFSFVL